MENIERYKHLNKYLKEKFGERSMELDLKNLYKKEVLVNKNSDVLMTFNSKFSLDDAKFVNNIKAWEKF